jgi:transposase InsO family protein
VQINGKSYYALLDTGADRSVMHYETYLHLELEPLDKLNVLTCYTANGAPILSHGYATAPIQCGEHNFNQRFIVVQDLTRPIILGRDFMIANHLGVQFTREGTKKLTRHEDTILEIPESPTDLALFTRQRTIIPPMCGALVDVSCMGTLPEQSELRPSALLSTEYPELYLKSMCYEHHQKGQDIPIFLVNTSNTRLHIPPDKVLAFAVNHTKTEIAFVEEDQCHFERDDSEPEPLQCRNWIPSPRPGRPGYPDPRILSGKSPTKSSATVSSPGGNCVKGDPSRATQDKTPPKKRRRTTSPERLPGYGNSAFMDPAEVSAHRRVDLGEYPITEETRQKLKELLEQNEEVFSKNSEDIGYTKLTTMKIDTGDHPPIAQRPYTIALKHYEWVREEIRQLEKAGIIRESVSPWASPIVVVPKKSEPGEPPRRRLCVDFRKINSLQPDVEKGGGNGCLSLYPLPKIDEMLLRLRGKKCFTTLDLRAGYHHIALDEESKGKTSFVTPFGKFEYNTVPFGLAQAPAWFQRTINIVLQDLGHCAMAYLDDIIIFSDNEQDHLRHIQEVFNRLRQENINMKLKKAKCQFFRSEIQYLGHLVTGSGFRPLPEKLEAIRNMPPPKNAKQIRQFLGLAGYYRKFVPRFADISKPMTELTKKDPVTKRDIEFIWTPAAQKSFELLKEFLTNEPILKYPDPDKPYIMYTDASKYGWAGLLTQAYDHQDSTGKVTVVHHPVVYVSGLFRGSQLNWAAMTKEAYAIYMVSKKLSFYTAAADILLRSDHLPLKRFLVQQTMNSKVNNWAVELSCHRFTFEHISGPKNILADTLSRLLEINPDLQQAPEPAGEEFGYTFYEELPPVSTTEVNCIWIMDIAVKQDPEVVVPPTQAAIPREQLRHLQQEDPECRKQVARLMQLYARGKTCPEFYIEDGIIMKRLQDNGFQYETIVLPRKLIGPVLLAAHQHAGHNGTNRTYLAVRRMYYWRGIKREIRDMVTACPECQKHNTKVVKFDSKFFKPCRFPMEMLCCDLVGEFHPPTPEGHRYAFTAICMLTGYVFCIPIKNKTAECVTKAYLREIYAKFGGSRRILTDNGTEFVNALFKKMCDQLHIQHVTSPAYRPQSNGKIEGFHRFLKLCVSKLITQNKIYWDEAVHMATAAYNFFPCQASRESGFFAMFGRDALTPLSELLQPKPRYLGEDGLPDLDALSRVYHVIAKNLEFARARKLKELPSTKKREALELQYRPGDPVLVKDHTAKGFAPRYKDQYRVVTTHGQNRVTVRDQRGKESTYHVTAVKKVQPAYLIADSVPDYKKFGRLPKLDVPHPIPDLKWHIDPGVQVEAITLENVEYLPDELPTELYQVMVDFRTARLSETQNPVRGVGIFPTGPAMAAEILLAAIEAENCYTALPCEEAPPSPATLIEQLLTQPVVVQNTSPGPETPQPGPQVEMEELMSFDSPEGPPPHYRNLLLQLQQYQDPL